MPKGNTKEIPKEVPKEIPKVVSKKGAHRGFQRVSQRGFPGKLNLQTPDQLLKAVAKAWVAEAAKFSLSLCCSLFSLVPSGVVVALCNQLTSEVLSPVVVALCSTA